MTQISATKTKLLPKAAMQTFSGWYTWGLVGDAVFSFMFEWMVSKKPMHGAHNHI